MKRRNILLALRWYHPKIHAGVAHYAGEHNWILNARMAYAVWEYTNWTGDGIITQPATLTIYDRWQGTIEKLKQPRVVLNKHILNDDHAIAHLAANHFMERGFHHYAAVGGGTRAKHFCDIISAANAGTVDLWPNTSAYDWENHQKHYQKLLHKSSRPLAVFCIQDDIAAEVMQISMDLGCKIPEEVAILGVHNDDLICDYLPVPLSSVDNNMENLGYEAAALLDRHLDGEPLPTSPILVAPKGVVTRLSTDTLAVNHTQVVRALRYMKAEHGREIGLPQIIAASGMSQSGFFEAFSKHMHTTVGNELIRIRLDHAEQLLWDTDLKIAQIAEISGFGDPRNLYRAFKKHRNSPPHSIRKKGRQL